VQSRVISSGTDPREDVNRDRRPELICEFAVRGSGHTPADTTVVLHARTVAGILLSGTDRIRVR
jgi:hypothetical protein